MGSMRGLGSVPARSLALALAAAGCQAPADGGLRGIEPAAGDLAVGDALMISQSIGGSRCALRKAGQASGRVEQFDIHCAGWEDPSGTFWRLPQIQGRPLRTLLEDPDLPVWGGLKGSCGALTETALGDGRPALSVSCLASDGWPESVFATESGGPDDGFILIGRGLPHLAPVFEDAVALLQDGRAAPEVKRAGSKSRMILLAERALDVDGKLLTLEDVHDFRELTRLATLYNHAGDFVSAEMAHRNALMLQEKLLGPGDPALGRTMAATALNLSNQGQDEAASLLFAKAEPLAQKSSTQDYAQYLAYRGMHETRHAGPEVGKSFIQRSRDLRAQLYGPESLEVAYSFYLEGDALGHAGDDRGAVKALTRALTLFGSQADPEWTAFTLEWLAEYHRRLGELDLARAEAARGSEIIQAAFGDGIRLARALTRQAAIERDAGQPARAMQLYRRSIDVALGDRIALSYLTVQDVEPYLELLFESAVARPGDAQALLAEAVRAAQAPQEPATAKAIELMAARIAEGEAGLGAAARALQDAARTRQALRLKLARAQLAADEERDPDAEERLRVELQAAIAETDQLERALQARFPTYGQLVAPQVLDVPAIAAVLRPREALVQLLVGDAATYGLLITSDGTVRGNRAAIPAERLAAMVSGLRDGVDWLAGPPAFDHAASHQLYRLLFGQLDPALDSVDHLIYVPQGPLLSLPPALFVRRPPTGEGHAGASWLIRDFAVSIVPTIGAVQKLREVARPSGAPEPFLGIGDPSFGGEPGDAAALEAAAAACRLDEFVDPALLRRLQPLPETRDELSRMAESLGAGPDALLLAEAASEPMVRSTNLADYRVLAFATHGLLPGELRCQSEPALALTPPRTPSESEDGLLDASEVALLDLDADWVVLSACNTAGPSGAFGGASLSGLARAFFYAGARALLVSHWAVASEPTVTLTTGTIGAVAGQPGTGKAEALRQAQLAMIDDPATAEPAFWAPFTLIGDGGWAAPADAVRVSALN